MIEVEHLYKSYGSVDALTDVSFDVERGEVVGFLGPNGAGKTTTLRILAGFLGATAGHVRIGGHDVVQERHRAQQQIGYLAESSPLYPEMRVREYLRFRAELKGIARRQRHDQIARALELAGASHMRDVLIGVLSRGYRQRVGLADALLGAPPLLILDEPTASLDPNQIREIRHVLRQLRGDHTILLSTHILSEVEATCSRAIVIARGRIVAQGAIPELRQARQRATQLRLVVHGPRERVLEVIAHQPGLDVVSTREVDDGCWAVVVELAAEEPDGTPDGPPTERLAFALAEARLGLRALEPLGASLEQVFAELTETDDPSPPNSDALPAARSRDGDATS